MTDRSASHRVRPTLARRRGRWAALAGVACLALGVEVQAQPEPGAARLGQDTFMSGQDVRVDDEVLGDALLVGGSIHVGARVHGDGVFAGHELALGGPFGSDLYAAGGSVRLEGDVAGNARMAGGDVSIGPDAAVAGGVSIAAGRVDVAGSVGQYLLVAAGSTRVSGHVGGDLDVSGDELELAPSAEIEGRVTFRGPEPASVAPGARVHGEVVHVPSGESAGPWQRLFDTLLFVTLAALGMGAVGWASATLAPRFARSAQAQLESHSGAALLAGLGLALGGPLAVALLSLSLVGIPLALVVACAYMMSFPLGYVLAAASIGERLHARVQPARGNRKASRALTLLAPLFGLGLLAGVPVIGPSALVALTLIGMGALVLEIASRVRRRDRAERPASGLEGAGPAPSARRGDARILM